MARATVCGLLSAALVAACTTHDTVRPLTLPKLAPLPVGPASVVDAEPQAELAPPAVDVAEPDVEPAPPVRLAPGVYPHEVNIEGQVRRWTTVVPPDGGGIDPAGLVVVLHGVGGRGIDIRSTTGLEQPARGRGVVFAYPDAIGGAWNDGRPGADPMQPNVTVDDVHFLRLMIDATLTRTGVPPRKVAVVGFSNGAVMAAKAGCELAEHVTAVVMVAGSAGQGFEQTCRPARPVSAMLVAGDADPIVPYGGGKVADMGTKKRGFVASVDDFASFWSRHNGCSSLSPVAAPPPVTEMRGVNCGGGTAVQRYRIAGGGHEWFRAPRFSTADAIWEFVSRRFATPTYLGA